MNQKRIFLLMIIIFALWLTTGCGEDKTVMPGEDALVLSEEEEMPLEKMLPQEEQEQAVIKSLFVHICGAVAYPGVYELPVGSRVYEAVEKAGGFSAEACKDYMNLAMPLSDGEKLNVPTMEEVRKATEAGEQPPWGNQENPNTSERNTADGLVNINKASVQELCTLTGIGESRALAIIAYREKNGRFSAIEDIMKVTGIKEGMFEKIKEKITV